MPFAMKIFSPLSGQRCRLPAGVDRPEVRGPVRQHRMERAHPIRAAITVAGIVGHGSTSSTTEPRTPRWYFGGPSLRNAPASCSC